jgi:hypothetical protein
LLYPGPGHGKHAPLPFLFPYGEALNSALSSNLAEPCWVQQDSFLLSLALNCPFRTPRELTETPPPGRSYRKVISSRAELHWTGKGNGVLKVKLPFLLVSVYLFSVLNLPGH